MDGKIKAVVKEVKSTGWTEIYIELKVDIYPLPFYVMLEGEKKCETKRGDKIIISLYSVVTPKKSKEDSKKVIIDKDEHYLVDYVGQVIEEVNNKLLIDASLPIFVDKKEGIGVGDYVTGNGHHTIQAYLEKDDKDAIKP